MAILAKKEKVYGTHIRISIHQACRSQGRRNNRDLCVPVGVGAVHGVADLSGSGHVLKAGAGAVRFPAEALCHRPDPFKLQRHVPPLFDLWCRSRAMSLTAYCDSGCHRVSGYFFCHGGVLSGKDPLSGRKDT